MYFVVETFFIVLTGKIYLLCSPKKWAQRKINGDTHKSSRACIGRTSRPQCLLTLP